MFGNIFTVTIITMATIDEVVQCVLRTGLKQQEDILIGWTYFAQTTGMNGTLINNDDSEKINVLVVRAHDLGHADKVFNELCSYFDGSVVFHGDLLPPPEATMPEQS